MAVNFICYHVIAWYMGSSSKCLQCGYRWSHPTKTPSKCPNCKSVKWNEEPEGDFCSVGGGTCELCGCTFWTGALQAHFCPNCGSSKWDENQCALQSSPNAKPAARFKKYECLDCGYVWASSMQSRPKRCPNRKNQKGRYCGSRNFEEIEI